LIILKAFPYIHLKNFERRDLTMKKFLIIALALTLVFLTACSGTSTEELSDALAKVSPADGGTISGAIRFTFPKELTKNEILKDLDVQDQAEDVVLESFFNAEIDEANKKAKIAFSNSDGSHLADIFIDSDKYYLEMENLFKFYSDKMGGTLSFSMEDMKGKKFLNIPRDAWRSHLPTMHTALTTAVSENETLVQEDDNYYALTLTSPEFASSITSPFKEWMSDGYEFVYAMVKKDSSQALTLTIPDRIKIDIQWSINKQKVNVATPEGILLENVLKSKPTSNQKPETKPATIIPEKDTDTAPKEEGKAESPNNESKTSIKSALKAAIKGVSDDRKLLTAKLFNENDNLDSLMTSTAKWLSPLQECYRQTNGNYTYLGLTSLPHETCLPSERDAVNINFYRMGTERKIEIFLEYDEPNAIKQQLDTYISVCEKCGYEIDKESLIQLIEAMQRDAKILVKGTEEDYYMEESKDENVGLSAYVAFVGDRYIYMITLDESR